MTKVTFENLPAFAVHLDAKVEVPELSTVTVDVSYGGMFYVIADAKPFGLRLTPDEGRDIVRIGEMIKAATQEQLQAVHPENPEIAGVTIAQLSGPPAHPDAEVKNAVIVSTGVLDWNRPSTWTGALDRIPLRNWNLRQDGRPPRQRKVASTPRLPTRGSSGHHLRWSSGARVESRRLPRSDTDTEWTGMDNRFRTVRCRFD